MAAFMVATMLVVPMASIGLVSDGGSDYEAYAEATDRSGKKVSIIGDGISTLEGYNYPGNSIYYTASKMSEKNITVHTNWWGRLIDSWGAELLVNESYYKAECASGAAARANQAVVDHLSDGTDDPDIVLVFVGSNDYLNCTGAYVSIGSVTDSSIEGYIASDAPGKTAYENLACAYSLMLKRIIDAYQTADRELEVICLLPYVDSSAINTITAIQFFQRDTLNSQISTVCDYFRTTYGGGNDVKCIDLSKCGMPERFTKESTGYYEEGGSYSSYTAAQHPNNAGFQLISDYIMEELSGIIVHRDGRGIPEGNDYLYRLDTDTTNTNVTDVLESHIVDGVATSMVSKYRVGSGSADASRTSTGNTTQKINAFWDFDPDTGMGPFNSFYAAVNLYGGETGDDMKERRMHTGAGQIGYVLDPYNLKKTLGGTMFDPYQYNIMLIIPTVYWKAMAIVDGKEVEITPGLPTIESLRLYMSSKPSYEAAGASPVTGMTATGHRAQDGTIMPYLALGVYEGGQNSGRLVSQSGTAPAVDRTLGQFEAMAAANLGSGDGEYGVWNYYQWLLYKMMSYTVMGTKNSQGMVGRGLSSGSMPPGANMDTGSMDYTGPYYGSYITSTCRTTGAKMFLENTWGSAKEFVSGVRAVSDGAGGAMLIGYKGEALLSWVAMEGQWYDSVRSYGASWDTYYSGNPAERTGATDEMGLNRIGDRCVLYVPTGSSYNVLTVGGDWQANNNRTGINNVQIILDASGLGPRTTARLSYLMSPSAVDLALQYSSGDGLGPVPAKTTVEWGEAVELPGQGEMVAPGKNMAFVGWECSADGKVYLPNSLFTVPACDVVLTAVWESEEEEEKEYEEDEDDIFDILRHRQQAPAAAEKDRKWILVAASAVAVCTAACLVMAIMVVRKHRNSRPIGDGGRHLLTLPSV